MIWPGLLPLPKPWPRCRRCRERLERVVVTAPPLKDAHAFRCPKCLKYFKEK